MPSDGFCDALISAPVTKRCLPGHPRRLKTNISLVRARQCCAYALTSRTCARSTSHRSVSIVSPAGHIDCTCALRFCGAGPARGRSSLGAQVVARKIAPSIARSLLRCVDYAGGTGPGSNRASAAVVAISILRVRST